MPGDGASFASLSALPHRGDSDRIRGITLPIHRLQEDFGRAVGKGPLVVTGATGSGKSTEVPRWCPDPVIVVEPRRVACRALAARVAELEGTEVGQAVGYAVRDDRRAGADTRILFVTPGVALRSLETLEARAGTFVLDEVHERSLETDLLLALLSAPKTRDRLVAMSATIDGESFARDLGARHLHAEGRAFPVEIEHAESGPIVPSPDRLAERVARAVKSSELDTLVFLPGKAEIGRAQAALRGLDADVLELHGQVPPAEQARVFRGAKRRKVILSTNVAETSVTVPGIRLVIDSGLARQIRYVQGRGTLALIPIARDAAEQRAGRAGRTAPGRCVRLWQRNAHLEAVTPPELHRVSLVPLVLAAAAHKRRPEDLAWLDPPKEHAVTEARGELQRLGALDGEGHITERGQALFRLPLDPWLGRLLVEAEESPLLEDAIDLAAVLSLGRPLFRGPLREHDDAREGGCDLVAGLLALRGRGGPAVDTGALVEARSHRDRLRRVFGRSGRGPGPEAEIPRRDLLDIVLRADSRAARVRRERGRRTHWGGEGSEMELDRNSSVALVAAQPEGKEPEALVVLGLRSFREGTRLHLMASMASGVSLDVLDAHRLGVPRMGAIKLVRGKVRCEIEHVYAGRVLRREELRPKGEQLREALAQLIERGTFFPGLAREIESRWQAWTLARRLAGARLVKDVGGILEEGPRPAELKDWLRDRLLDLGLEEQEDLALVDREDLTVAPVPEPWASNLDKDYPRSLRLGSATYRVRYEVGRRRVLLELESGALPKAPPRSYLPRFPGFKVSIQAGGSFVEID